VTSGDTEAGVAFELDPQLPAVATDAERLRTALVNILSNARAAVQAGRAGSRPASAGAGAPAADVADVLIRTQPGPKGVTVVVQDAGVGISAEDLPHIFDPYFTTRRAGTGLGLPIAKNIIEGLGGTITASSRPGAGTEIRIDLPMTAPENPV
jgi:signal transduction histidine kinase